MKTQIEWFKLNFAHPAQIRTRIGIRIRWLCVRFVGQIFVDGRIPSQKYGASIRPSDEYPLKKTSQVFVHGRIRC